GSSRHRTSRPRHRLEPVGTPLREAARPSTTVHVVCLTTAHHLRTGQGDRPSNRDRSGPFVRCMRMLDGILHKRLILSRSSSPCFFESVADLSLLQTFITGSTTQNG